MTILFEVPRIRVGYFLIARPVVSLTLCGLYMWTLYVEEVWFAREADPDRNPKVSRI